MANKRVQLFDKQQNVLFPQARIDNIYAEDGVTKVDVATLAQVELKANIASPTFTGTVTVPAITETSANEAAANKGYVDTEIESVEGAVALKADIANPTFTGTVTIPVINESSADAAAANKKYVDDEIAAAIGEVTSVGVSYETVTVLPETGLAGRIYLLPDADAPEGNVYLEYMYINGKWEVIGTTVADLDNKADLAGAAFTGTVTVPDVAADAGNTVAANKGYVDGAKNAAVTEAGTLASTAKSEAIAEAGTLASTAKSEAIAAAESDATEKANAAQAAAEATAAAALKGVTDQLGELGTVVYYKELTATE